MSIGLVVLLVLLVGPILILRSAFRRSSKTPEKPKSNAARAPAPSAAKVNEKRPADEYRELLRDLGSSFAGGTRPPPSKSDMAKLQRLARLVEMPELAPIVDRQKLIAMFKAGQSQVDAVYGEGNSTGQTRTKSFAEAVSALEGGQTIASATQSAPAAAAKATTPPARTAKLPKPRFGLPFDVDGFAKRFASGWSIVSEYDPEDGTLLEGPDGERIGVACHQLEPSASLRDAVQRFADNFDERSEIDQFKSSIGTRGWSVEVNHGDEQVLLVELYGPALMSVRFLYFAEELDNGIADKLKQAAAEMTWLNAPVEPSPALTANSLDEVRKHIKTVLKGQKDLRDELLNSFEDEDRLYLIASELEAVAELGPSAYPLIRALISYAVERSDVDTKELADFHEWAGPQFLNDPRLRVLLVSKAEASLSSTSDHLALADMLVSENDKSRAGELVELAFDKAKTTSDFITFMEHPLLSADESTKEAILARAIDAAETIGQMHDIVEHEAATKPNWKACLDKLGQKATDDAFWDHGYNLVDVMAAAVERKFVTKAQAKQALLELVEKSDALSDRSAKAKVVEPDPERDSETAEAFNSAINDVSKLDEFEPVSMQLLELVKSAHQNDWRDTQETLLAKAMGAATTPEQKYAVYRYLLDEIEDKKKAQTYLKANEGTLKPFLDRKMAAKRDEGLLDAICQCAMLVAIGDGEFTSVESSELEQVRGIAGMMYRNRGAIALLEESKDIETARASRSSTAIVHSLGIFTPGYIREVSDALEDVGSREDLDALCKAYAARIEDPFGRRLAAWAANEVAGSDGLDAAEKRALKLMADIWGLSLQENQRYFSSYVYPLISDEIEFDNPDNRAVADLARDVDGQLREAMGDEAAIKLTEALGVGSLEELVERLGLGEAEEDDEPEDTEDLPPMFAALLERNDWDEVLAAIKAGADVNETITLNGLSGLSILSLAAEHGTVEIVKALVEAGADVNRVIGDVRRASGYNTPLIASLKNGGRMDIFGYLLDVGANPDPFADKEAGWTPLTIAARNENHKAIKELLARGVDVNIATSAGANAFKTVAAQESANARKCMDLLVKAGIDVARLDDEGFAGIHNAAASGSVKLVQHHIEKAKVPIDLAMPLYATTGAYTPLLNAMSWGNIPVVDYLLQKGANPSLKRSGFGIYAAITRAAKDGDWTDPVEQLERFLALDVRPELDEIAEIMSILASDAGEETEELAEFLEKLVMASKVSPSDRNSEHTTELMEAMAEAQDNFPDAAGRMIGALVNKGLVLED